MQFIKKYSHEYADICGASESHLIIFDRRKDIRCDEKIFTEKSEFLYGVCEK